MINTQNKRYDYLFAFLSVAVVLVVLYINSERQNNVVHEINSEQLQSMIVQEDNLFLIDLREPELYKEGKINNSINIPFAEIEKRYSTIPKDKKIIFICHTGRMGMDSGNLLLENGYRNVYNLEGGIAKWTGPLT